MNTFAGMMFEPESLRDCHKKLKATDSREKFITLFKDPNYHKLDKLVEALVNNGECPIKYSQEYIGTPRSLVDEMVATLPDSIFTNHDSKCLDPVCGNGTFLYSLFNRYMVGLSGFESDSFKRAQYIWKNCLYGCDINPEIPKWICNIIFKKYKVDISNSIISQDSLNEGFTMKFDVVVGNPPYQGSVGSGKITGNDGQLYPSFVKKSLEIGNIVLMITPHKWTLVNYLKDFKTNMLKNSGIKLLKKFNDSDKVFGPNVTIKGGPSYFLCEKGYTGLITFTDSSGNSFQFDAIKDGFHRFQGPLLRSILSKMKNKTSTTLESKDNGGKLKSNDVRLMASATANSVKVYCSKGSVKYLDRQFLIDVRDYNKWKVILPNACSANKLSKLARTAEPDSTTNQSRVFMICNSQSECQNLISYLDTTVIRFLTSLVQESHNITKPLWQLTPAVDLSKPWTNQDTMNYFDLTQDELEWMALCIKDFNIDKC